MNSHRHLAVFVAIALLTASSSVWAFDDEMTFDPDELEEMEDDDDDHGDDMTFAPDDLDEEGFDPDADIEDAIDVGVVAVPSDVITDAERDQLQDMLERAAEEVPEITVHGDTDILPALVDRDADYCSRESLCLARIGDGAGVERIAQVRVEEVDGGSYRLDIDYFDVGDRLFVAYHSNSGLGDIDDIIDAIPPGVDDIFGIRRAPDEDPFVDQRDVDVAKFVTYFAGGASLISFGLGGFFGMRARSQQNDLDSAETDDDGRYVDLTQSEARSQRRSMESNARNANISYVTGGILAATSITLFILSSGDDDLDGDASWYQPDTLSPGFDDDGFGVGASWSF